MCDEISLKKGLNYNKYQDYIEVCEDFSKIGRKQYLANQALVFYLRGLLYKWKIPFCYFARKLQKEVIQKVLQIRPKPRVLVYDQGLNNRAA